MGASITAGSTIAYRKHGHGRRVGMLVERVEQVSERTTYVYGVRARVSDGAATTTKISALIGEHDAYEVIGEPTAGQELTDELRRYFRIGARTRRYRGRGDLHADMLEAIRTVAQYPGCYSERTERPLRPAFAVFLAYTKHVDGYRVDGTLRRRITEMSPWQFAALLGRMLDAGVTNTGEGERFFADMARGTRTPSAV